MSVAPTHSSRIWAGDEAGAVLARAASSPWFTVALVLFAVAQQCMGHQNGDNSWLFTVAEKTLAGGRPYVDIVETNPPASFMFYMPGVALAHLLRAPVEFMVSALFFPFAGAFVLLAGAILRRGGLLDRSEENLTLNAAIFCVLILPAFSFAEREHIASILLLPPLAILAIGVAGERPRTWQAVLAGLAAGLAIALKPHFALPLALPLFYVAARRRSLACVFTIENIVAVAFLFAYAGFVFAVFPALFDILPATLDAYVPLKEPYRVLLREPWLLLNVALLVGLAVAMRSRRASARVMVPILASLGFIGTFVAQGKGWVNHGLPGVVMAFLAVAMFMSPAIVELRDRGQDALWSRVRRVALFVFFPAAIGAPILFGAAVQFSAWEEYAGLTAAVTRNAPPHPKIIALSPQLDVGHPLVRRLGGTWVGRPNAVWLAINSRTLLDEGVGDAAYRARLAGYIARDIAGFREDVRANEPDVILVDRNPGVVQAMQYPDIAAAMADYRLADTAADIGVWVRRR